MPSSPRFPPPVFRAVAGTQHSLAMAFQRLRREPARPPEPDPDPEGRPGPAAAPGPDPAPAAPGAATPQPAVAPAAPLVASPSGAVDAADGGAAAAAEQPGEAGALHGMSVPAGAQVAPGQAR
jgi:hypothetical protein